MERLETISFFFIASIYFVAGLHISEDRTLYYFYDIFQIETEYLSRKNVGKYLILYVAAKMWLSISEWIFSN